MKLTALRVVSLVLAAGGVMASAWDANAQLRVGTWNISNYSGGRTSDLHTAMYGVFSGRSFAPDVFMVQEVLSASALAEMVTIMNTAPGSPGDWAAAAYVDGADTESVFLYRTSKVTFVQQRTIAVGSSDPNNQPRNTYRYDIRPIGYAAVPAASLALYSVHMKAGSASSDNARRLVESQRIRDNAEGVNTNGAGSGLPTGWNFLVGGDFNVQNSSQSAYQELVGSQANNTGRFFDPINTPGSWNNSSAFRIVHTQDPTGAGGMDDRHDQILLGGSLINGTGFDYIGNPAIPYSTTTWNDANHSYRAWGNDGTTFDDAMRITGNAMVGAVIAQAIANVCGETGGHLPILLDLRVPAKASVSTVSINFGQVQQGDPATFSLNVSNGGNVALWTANGIANLNYSMIASSGFTAPGGGFVDAAGGAVNSHTITMDTSTVGVMNGSLTITSDAPETPTIVIALTGEVVGGAPNLAPVADAGADIVVTDVDGNFSEPVVLDGSASFDSDGTIVNYLWKRNLSTIYNGPNATANFLAFSGTSTITLTVTDDDGATAVDTMTVKVNARPNANAGADQNLVDVDNSGDELVTLDGSASTDPDGGITNYQWMDASNAVLANSASATADVLLPVGVHTITLTVTDTDDATRTDEVVITIEAGTPTCIADFDGNGGIDGGDLAAFFEAFETGDPTADVDGNGGVDGGDLAFFFERFEAGC